MKTRVLAPTVAASLGLVVLVACSSSNASEAVTPTSVQIAESTTSSATPETSTSTIPATTVPATTTSAPVAPSTTAPKRQATTTVPAAPKTKTPVITGTPSEILDKLRADVLAFEQKIFDSGNFGLYGQIGPLQKKYAGAATLSYKSSSTEQYYTATSGALTQAWYVEMIDAELVLVER
jgi:hypothetical protein